MEGVGNGRLGVCCRSVHWPQQPANDGRGGSSTPPIHLQRKKPPWGARILLRGTSNWFVVFFNLCSRSVEYCVFFSDV